MGLTPAAGKCLSGPQGLNRRVTALVRASQSTTNGRRIRSFTGWAAQPDWGVRVAGRGTAAVAWTFLTCAGIGLFKAPPGGGEESPISAVMQTVQIPLLILKGTFMEIPLNVHMTMPTITSRQHTSPS